RAVLAAARPDGRAVRGPGPAAAEGGGARAARDLGARALRRRVRRGPTIRRRHRVARAERPRALPPAHGCGRGGLPRMAALPRRTCRGDPPSHARGGRPRGAGGGTRPRGAAARAARDDGDVRQLLRRTRLVAHGAHVPPHRPPARALTALTRRNRGSSAAAIRRAARPRPRPAAPPAAPRG